MTGSLVVCRAGAPLLPHTHVRLGLEPAGELRFADARRFGMLFVVRADDLAAEPRLARLGPEPFGPAFTAAYLQERARRVRKPIKNFLMDAAVVAGVGNIYATEALWRAGVHPRTAAGRLRQARWQRLHAAVLEVLAEALREGGTTLQDYRNAEGDAGAFQLRLGVYDRSGEACRRCGRPIRRIVQAGRSTFYCPGCQH
jgi:formamidopyrimidine-DNA glycosylase